MIFSSIIFIFGFLPIVLLGNFLLRNHIKVSNIFLFLMSLLFYAWGEPRFVLVLIISILVNWGIALYIEKGRLNNTALVVAVLFNVGILFVFKYFAWCTGIFNSLFDKSFAVLNISLPIGISFYTFQALSYVIDVWRGNVKAQKNIFNLGLYISLFPQLVAGPIVRYVDIEKQITYRRLSRSDVSDGISRFLIGFSKKVLLADSFAVIADKAFALLGADSLETGFAWLGAISYTLQIFYDFSGYSDMAIGLGKMLGFSFNENFNYPYCASTITDFWRRWHISLSTWFRDYVYIPLGGNRKGIYRTCLNLAVVWTLTGIWHGANTTFLLWGAIYGALIIVEKKLDIPQKILAKGIVCRFIYRMLTILVVIMCWVIFRAESVNQAIAYFTAMWKPIFSVDGLGTAYLYIKEYRWELIAGLLFSCPIIPKLQRTNKLFGILVWIAGYIFFFISISYLIKGTYSPFIYFNF